MPVYEISDAVATEVGADRAETYAALLDVDLVEVGRSKPLIGFLGALRALPEVAVQLMHGERPPKAPERMRLHDLAGLRASEGGWILLGERENEEIALGLIGKFWKPVIDSPTFPRRSSRSSLTRGSRSTSTPFRFRSLSTATLCCELRCASPQPTSIRRSGFVATGHLGSVQAPTS